MKTYDVTNNNSIIKLLKCYYTTEFCNSISKLFITEYKNQYVLIIYYNNNTGVVSKTIDDRSELKELLIKRKHEL